MFRNLAHTLVRHPLAGRSLFRPSWACWAILWSATALPIGAMPKPVLAETVQDKATAILYEEDTANPSYGRYPGTVTWHTEKVTTVPGQKPDTVVYADIDIPQKLTARWSIQRNDDREMPASHVIKVQFTVAPGSPHGSVINVMGMMVKAGEKSPEARLTGLIAKVENNYFLMGLTNLEADRKRNIEWLQERPWLDVPIFFANAKRAILSFDEGDAGKHALAEAFATWEKP